MTSLARYSEDLDVPPLSGGARAAVLLLALGSEGASRVLKHMAPDEIVALRQAAATLNEVLPEQIEAVVEEFSDTFKRGPIFPGPSQQMTKLLKSALTENEFQSLFPNERQDDIDRILYADTRNVWEAMAEMEGAVLAGKLSGEHPHIVALLLSKLPSDVSVAIIKACDPTMRNDIMRRMLMVKPLAAPVQALFETHVREAYLVVGDDADNGSSHTVLANVINRMDKTDGNELIEIIEADMPEDALQLKKLLFAFEDIPTMPARARLTLFDGIAADTVIMALRGADETIRESVLAAHGARARRMIEAELGQNVQPLKQDIEAARREIANLALEMAGAGTIQLRDEEGAA